MGTFNRIGYIMLEFYIELQEKRDKVGIHTIQER